MRCRERCSILLSSPARPREEEYDGEGKDDDRGLHHGPAPVQLQEDQVQRDAECSEGDKEVVHADVEPLALVMDAEKHRVGNAFEGADARADEEHDQEIQCICRPEVIQEEGDGQEKAPAGHEARLVGAVSQGA